MTDFAKPIIDTRKRISVIWIIPILASVVGLWMVIHTKLSEGPTITIRFENANGLVAHKTKVEYLDVAVGQVQDVRLNENKDGVVVTVQMNPEAKGLLRDDTQFWVVRARVGMGSVTGLGTLLGGVYIKLSPGTEASYRDSFVGLETPPLTPVGTPGVKLNLFSKKAGSITTGNAVLYNGYKVGRVEGMKFDEEKKLVHYNVFVDAPFDTLVTSSVRFWNISGINLKASAEGIDIQTGSLNTIFLGGIAFQLPDGTPPGEPIENGADFYLYDSYEQIQEKPYRHSVEYVVEFSQSLRGLVPGAPVEYRGIPIGHVKKILFSEMLNRAEKLSSSDPEKLGSGLPIAVLITIEPGRLGLPDTQDSVEFLKKNIEMGVRNGLRASLMTGNLLTGSLFISADYYEDVDTKEIGSFASYETIPTIHVGLGRIEEQVSHFLSKLNDLPLEQTIENIDQMVATATGTIDSINMILNDSNARQMPAELNATLESFREILEGLSPDSQAFQSFEDSLEKLNRTFYNLNELTSTLKERPNSLIFHPNFPSDPIPGAK